MRIRECANLQDKSISIATDLDDFPLFYLDATGTVRGLTLNIVDTLSVWLNFTYTTSSAPDKLWGELENNSWTGLLGEVAKGNNNMTINFFIQSPERSKYFEASIPYMFEGFGFAAKMPDPLPPWKRLLQPFSLNVWLFLTAIVLLFPSLVKLLLGTQLGGNASRSPPLTGLVVVVMSFLRQNIPRLPTRSADRLALMGWLCFGMFVTLYYTSNLIAVITIPVFPPGLKTINDLASSNFRVAMVDYWESLPNSLLVSSEEHLRLLGRRLDLVSMVNVSTHQYESALFEKMIEGSHVITDTNSYLRDLVSKRSKVRGNFYFLEEQLYSGPLVLYFRKDTPWVHCFNTGIQRLIEAGLVSKWYKDNMKNTSQVPQLTSSVEPLALHQLQGPFLILLLGTMSAAAVLLLELMASKFIYKK